MDNFLPVLSEVLRDLLGAGEMKGAQLKPLVAMEFEQRTGVSFAQAFWTTPKFSNLLGAFENFVEVDKPVGPGDIVVRIRYSEQHGEIGTASPSQSPAQIYIRPTLWHAFANPDAQRRRFYHRKTNEVVHFVVGSSTSQALEEKVSADPGFIEIKPISVSEHGAWMTEFISSHPLPDATRAALQEIAPLPYSSQLNRAFTAALEGHADTWRRFRTDKIVEQINIWAMQNGISVPELMPEARERHVDRATAVSSAKPTVSNERTDVRAMLHTLVDTLDENELSRILLPATMLAKIAIGGRH